MTGIAIFSQALDQSIRHLGLRVLKTPPQAPQANAICERVLGTLTRHPANPEEHKSWLKIRKCLDIKVIQFFSVRGNGLTKIIYKGREACVAQELARLLYRHERWCYSDHDDSWSVRIKCSSNGQRL